MHCRFFREEIRDCLADILADRLSLSSHLGEKLKRCAQEMNNPIVRLSRAGDKTQKFAVRSRAEDYAAIINISSSGIMMFCTRGTCQAAGKHKRSVKRLLQLTEAASLCDHLATMFANKELWRPEKLPEDDEEDEDTEVQVSPVFEENALLLAN